MGQTLFKQWRKCLHCIQEDWFTLFMPHCLGSFCQKLGVLLPDTAWVIGPPRSSFDPTACDRALCQGKKGMRTLPPCAAVSIQTQPGVQARREPRHKPTRSVGNQSPVYMFKADGFLMILPLRGVNRQYRWVLRLQKIF